MASEDYLPLFWKARREHLGNIQRVSEEIIKLYREAAADLAARAAASREGSLSERWASEYARSLEQRVKELEAGLYDAPLVQPLPAKVRSPNGGLRSMHAVLSSV